MCKGSIRVCVHYLDFQFSNFLYVFYVVKKRPLYEFQHTPLRKMIFFAMFHTSCGHEIWGYVPNSLRNKNMERHIPYLL
jgi:hypothetical protein